MDPRHRFTTPSVPPQQGGADAVPGPPPAPPPATAWPGWEPTPPQGPPPVTWGHPGPQGGGVSGYPPAGPPAPGHAPAPRRDRRWSVLVLAAVVVIAGAVAAVLVLTGAFSEEPDRPSPARATPAAPSPASPEEVTFHITDTLEPDVQVFEVLTVSRGGADVGTVEVSVVSPEAVLPVTARPGATTYELHVETVLADDSQLTCVGQVTIDVRDGASYAIGWSRSGDQCIATLVDDGNGRDG
jgi:hypothetical protein